MIHFTLYLFEKIFLELKLALIIQCIDWLIKLNNLGIINCCFGLVWRILWPWWGLVEVGLGIVVLVGHTYVIYLFCWKH